MGLGSLRKLGSYKKPTAFSVSRAKITPKTRVRFHRKEAVKNLKLGNYVGYRYHSKQIADINTRLVIAKMRGVRKKKL